MTPAARIVAGGDDVTGTLTDRLLSLTVVDEDGYSSDSVEIQIDVRGASVELPETDVRLELALGFRETGLVDLGVYYVDKVAGAGPALTMTITATAANMTGGLRAPKSRAWEETTLGEIVRTIAGEAGLSAAVSEGLAQVSLPAEFQTAESDLHFLGRLARRFDAAAKPAGGQLVVVERDRGRAADGRELPPVALDPGRLSDWDWDIVEREEFGSVEAEWGDVDAAERPVVTAGSGEPVHRLRHTFANAEDATRAAEAELAMSGRRAVELTATVAGFEPGLTAGAWADVTGIYPGIDGRFLVRRVEHRLAAGLTTSFRAERSLSQET